MENTFNEFDLLKNFLDNLEIGIFILDRNGYYLYVNKEYQKITQYNEDFFKNRSILDFKREGYLDKTVYEQVMKSRKTSSMILKIKYRLDSNYYYSALTTSVPYFDEHNEIKYLFCFNERIDSLIDRLQEGQLSKSYLNNPNDETSYSNQIIAESYEMKNIINLINSISHTDVNVLINGPTGSGKEIIAKYIHKTSSRHKEKLITLNCSSIPENLIESELFGYVKGAFTGASNEGKLGLIELANKGTLFLDEINSIPKSIQVKLLRVLETKKIQPIGSIKQVNVDFRLICASNEPLEKLISEDKFRLDLYYRINLFNINIPALKNRKADIIPFINHYLKDFGQKYNSVKVLSESTIKYLLDYSWPGNVRELKNCIERLYITSPKNELIISATPNQMFYHLDKNKDNKEEFQLNTHNPEFSNNFSYKNYIEKYDKKLFEIAAKELKDPIEIAKKFKINISSVYRKLKKYNIKL
ncbi:sigma-54 interaction domain-containing protein [Peptoniphilaceae bacterium SGI.131]